MKNINTFTSTTGHHVARFCADESGATAIEYGMIASGVGAFLAGTVYSLGDKVKALFTTLSGMF